MRETACIVTLQQTDFKSHGDVPKMQNKLSSIILGTHCFFLKFLEDTSPFRGVTDTPVLDFW